MKRIRTISLGVVLALAGLFVLAGPAAAHVTVSSTNAVQGGYATVTFKVPNEEADASTTKLVVQLPSDTPFASASTQPVPGWTAKLTKRKLAKPVTTDDGQITEGVTQIAWTASAGIKPGEFQQFDVSLGPLPKKSSITFKALQTYSNGEVVRWIETAAPGSSQEPDHPAPTLALSAAGGSATSAAPASQAAASSEGDDSSSNNTVPVVLSIVALVLAAGALGLGVVNRARRSA